MTTLMPQGVGIPLPAPNAISQPYWDGCARSELLYQRCEGCGRALFNPAPICRWCHSRMLTWHKSKGAGSVYSWSIVWRPQTPDFIVPYATAVVDVDEGYQMVTNIVGCEPEDMHLDMRVVVQFQPVGSGMVIPYFRPEES
jgi:uncharacterized protein